MLTLKRGSGLLLHPTSLPGPFGIGELGEAAYHWIDFLVQARQSVWQILPLGPTGYGDSPYQTTSVFAGNPLLIDLAALAKSGYLPAAELAAHPHFSENRVDFGAVIPWKKALLMQAYSHFQSKATGEDRRAFAGFCEQHNESWLDDYALFMTIKGQQEERAWHTWPKGCRVRESAALQQIRRDHPDTIENYKFQQFIFFRQWLNLKSYANERGISIMGDIPIYVTHDSADVWANQHLFSLAEDGQPTVVAGVPPDYFSPTGQLWGNPIYRWDVMLKNRFSWWKKRVRINLECVDLVRLDHFRGFESYWAVPFGEETAVKGEWLAGPGEEFFSALYSEFGELPLIAEDLGFITPEVEALRLKFSLPGMKILQFGFGDGAANDFLPHNYPTPQCVVYTGSHDNDTALGWFRSARDYEQRYCLDYLRCGPEQVAWEMIRTASSSVAVLSIFPVQDVLSLGNDARMNLPGQAAGNWSWRMTMGQLREEHAIELARLAEIYGRQTNAANEE